MPSNKIRPLTERLSAHLVRRADDECWPWQGTIGNEGYGTISNGKGSTLSAHRVAYELLVGPILVGLQIDHTCHNKAEFCPGGRMCPHRACVNPNHLEAVPGRVNRDRGRRATNGYELITHCPRGHPYDEQNTRYRKRGGRLCRACEHDYRMRRKAARQ